jgi:ferredoxin-type protein NapH
MRRLIQSASLLLLHSSWGAEAKWLCTPVLSCHSCALSWFACPVGVFVHYAGYHVIPLLALGTIALFGVLMGRLFCGWVCPFGFLQDMLHKIPGPKVTLPRWAGAGKYLVLLFMVALIPFLFGELTMYSFCRICPAAAIQVTIPAMIGGGLTTVSTATVVRLGILIGVLLLAVVASRGFCTVFCPIGAMMAPFNHVSFWRVKSGGSCNACGKCDTVCPTHVHPSERIQRGIDPNRAADCIVCHECTAACTIQAKSLPADDNA